MSETERFVSEKAMGSASEDLGNCENLFDEFPDGTRIVIRNGEVTFENLTGDLLDVARSLNPDDENLRMRQGEDGRSGD